MVTIHLYVCGGGGGLIWVFVHDMICGNILTWQHDMVIDLSGIKVYTKKKTEICVYASANSIQ